MEDTIQEIQISELDKELGYDKYDPTNKNTSNARNDFSDKTIRSEYEDILIKFPRDKNANFEPQLVKKIKKI